MTGEVKSGLVGDAATAAYASVVAIRGALPLDQQPDFDRALCEQLASAGIAIGVVAVPELVELVRVRPGTVRKPLDKPAEKYKLTAESLYSQLDTSHQAYQTVTGVLNSGHSRELEVPTISLDAMRGMFEEWLTADRLSYVNNAQRSDPELRFAVNATPNITISADEYAMLQQAFNAGVPSPRGMSSWARRIVDRCTTEELSGTHPENGELVHFSLVPNRFTRGLFGTVHTRDTAMTHLKRAKGGLPGLHFTSPLEAATYLYTLRAGGDTFTEGNVDGRTYNRHFHLPIKGVTDEHNVLSSCVDKNGQFCVFVESNFDDRHERALVG